METSDGREADVLGIGEEAVAVASPRSIRGIEVQVRRQGAFQRIGFGGIYAEQDANAFLQATASSLGLQDFPVRAQVTLTLATGHALQTTHSLRALDVVPSVRRHAVCLLEYYRAHPLRREEAGFDLADVDSMLDRFTVEERELRLGRRLLEALDLASAEGTDISQGKAEYIALLRHLLELGHWPLEALRLAEKRLMQDFEPTGFFQAGLEAARQDSAGLLRSLRQTPGGVA